MRLRCSAACSPGLEPLVVAELGGLGVRAGPAGSAIIPFVATPRQLYAACLRSGVASRVLVRVAHFPARSFADLEREASAIDWSPWTAGRATFRVIAVKSRLFHTAAVAERLERAVRSAQPPALQGRSGPGSPALQGRSGPGSPALQGRSGPGSPALQGRSGPGPTPFLVRLDHDHVTISADAGGEPLHLRGWRLATAKAPIRPTIAAAALRTVGWNGTTPLIDPFCGSGTIAIEAAGFAAGLAPGRLRGFAFQSWPLFAPGTWGSVQGEVEGLAHPPAAAVLAADRDPGACDAATANAARAGVAVEVRHQPLSALQPPEGKPGWLVTNPPWGARTGAGAGPDLRDLYATLGDLVRERLPDWGVALLVGDRRLAQATRLPLEHRWSTPSGGTRVHLLAVGHRGYGCDEPTAWSKGWASSPTGRSVGGASTL